MLVLTRKKFQALILENEKGTELAEIQVLEITDRYVIVEVTAGAKVSRKKLPYESSAARLQQAAVQVFPQVRMLYTKRNDTQVRLGIQAPREVKVRRSELPPRQQKAIAA